jgi:mannosylglycerate hydrolase
LAAAEPLRAAAAAVLRANDAGRWTKPSPAQYPHQWNWDSAFISLGWAEVDWTRATVEIESMLDARWRDGMVPHVHYDPERLAGYFPGPDWWPLAQTKVLRPGRLTSGITNPPVLAVAALEVGLKQPEAAARRDFWSRVYPDLRDFVAFFRDRRTLPGSPLPVMVHPWESGWDNSPRWDFLAAARLRPSKPYTRLDTVHVPAGQRPTMKDYDSFLALVELLEETGYEIEEYRRRSPFCVHDVLLDAAWHAAAVALNRMAAELGEPEPFSRAELREFAAAFEQAHWDEESGLYLDFDLAAGRRVKVATAAGVAALFGGFQAPARARRCLDTYVAASAEARPLCTVPPSEPAFDPARYWRGPVWLNVNWLAAKGLDVFAPEEAARLREQTLELVENGGLGEYFDALSGVGLGSPDFSWTAALTLDLTRPK